MVMKFNYTSLSYSVLFSAHYYSYYFYIIWGLNYPDNSAQSTHIWIMEVLLYLVKHHFHMKHHCCLSKQLLITLQSPCPNWPSIPQPKLNRFLDSMIQWENKEVLLIQYIKKCTLFFLWMPSNVNSNWR